MANAVYEVTTSDGKVYEVELPASPEDVGQTQPQPPRKSPLEPLGNLRLAPFGPPLRDIPATVAGFANAALGGFPKALYEGQPAAAGSPIAARLANFGYEPPTTPNTRQYPEPQSLSGKFLASTGYALPFGVAERAVGAATRALPLAARFAAYHPAIERAAQGGLAGLLADVPNVPEAPGRVAGFAAGNVVIPPVISKAIQGIRAIPQAFRPRLNPRTLPELMQVPEEQVSQLSSKDQTKWFQIKKEQQLAVLNQRSRVLKEQRILINKELGKSAQARSLQIRDQLPGLYHDQGVQYRSLYDAEFKPHAHKTFDEEGLRQFIIQRLKNDPERLADVSARLGLSNKPPETALSGLVDELGKPIPASEQPVANRTFGKLRQQAKEFGQSLPSSVRESIRTYTPEEDAIDETLNIISEFMESKGISLKNSSRLWAEWKPIQRQATAEFRPYNLVETRTQAASNRLKKLAKGIDPDNEVYARKLADYLGIDDLPGEVKQVVRKLDSNQKDLLAIQLQQEAVKNPVSPLAKAQYVAGKQYEASVEKYRRVLALVKWIAGGLSVGAGTAVAGSMLRRE